MDFDAISHIITYANLEYNDKPSKPKCQLLEQLKKKWQLKKPGNSGGLLCFQTLPNHAHRLPPMPSAAVNDEQVLRLSDTFFEARMCRSTSKQNLEAK